MRCCENVADGWKPLYKCDSKHIRGVSNILILLTAPCLVISSILDPFQPVNILPDSRQQVKEHLVFSQVAHIQFQFLPTDSSAFHGFLLHIAASTSQSHVRHKKNDGQLRATNYSNWRKELYPMKFLQISFMRFLTGCSAVRFVNNRCKKCFVKKVLPGLSQISAAFLSFPSWNCPYPLPLFFPLPCADICNLNHLHRPTVTLNNAT